MRDALADAFADVIFYAHVSKTMCECGHICVCVLRANGMLPQLSGITIEDCADTDNHRNVDT